MAWLQRGAFWQMVHTYVLADWLTAAQQESASIMYSFTKQSSVFRLIRRGLPSECFTLQLYFCALLCRKSFSELTKGNQISFTDPCSVRVMSPQCDAASGFGWRTVPPDMEIWKVVMNILNKQTPTPDKGLFYSWSVGWGGVLSGSRRKKAACYEMFLELWAWTCFFRS